MAARGTVGRRARRHADLLLAPLVLLLAAVLLTVALPQHAARAQERPRTIMEMLFGGRSYERQPQPRYEEPPRRTMRQRPSPRRAPTVRHKSAQPDRPAGGDQAEKKPDTVEKSADAKTVLVVGDFLAASLADGLQDAFSEDPSAKILDKADGSSGLVRDDHYDWVAELGPMIEETKPAVVVVMLGSNDRQPIDTPSGTLALRSDGWSAEYEKRVEALAKIVADKKLPLVWVGMPAFKYDRMTEDMVYLNDLYRKAAANAGGEFVDIWDGFVDSNGAFDYSGPDINGQPARLRNSDGITMTAAGREKLAFFAKKPILKAIDSQGGQITSLGPEARSNMQLPPIGSADNAVSTKPISFADPALDGGDVLLGGGSAASFSLEPSPRERLVMSGRSVTGVEGRADDFTWNKKAPAVSPRDDTVLFRGSTTMKAVRAQSGIEAPPPMPSLADAIIQDWAKAPSPLESDHPAETASKPAEQQPPRPDAPAGAPAKPEAQPQR